MIRTERAGDEVAIRAVETAAFGIDREAQIVDDLRGSDAYIPELSLVAEDGGAVVGHVIVSRGHVEPSGEPIFLLGPIGVVPERQGEGIGSTLVDAALAGARILACRAWPSSAIPPITSGSASSRQSRSGCCRRRAGGPGHSRSPCSTPRPSCPRAVSSTATPFATSARAARRRAPARGGRRCGASRNGEIQAWNASFRSSIDRSFHAD